MELTDRDLEIPETIPVQVGGVRERGDYERARETEKNAKRDRITHSKN